MTFLEQVRRLLGGVGNHAVERGLTDPSRRSFLKAALLGTAIAATVDVDKLLWTPGERTIFLPYFDDTIRYNNFVSWELLARDALAVLEKNLTIAKQVNRAYDRRFLNAKQIGETVNLVIPMRWDTGAVDHLKTPGRPVTLTVERFL